MNFQPRQQPHTGLIGVGVMGSNLAQNIIEQGFYLNIYDRNETMLNDFAERRLPHSETHATLENFVASLQAPRCILVMIKAGAPVDWVINELTPLLDADDLIVDLGNSHYRDTERRAEQLAQSNLLYSGCGVSGGAEGARHGPAMMPGGEQAGWERTRELFEAIAAKYEGEPCVSWVGKGGAGHFVKMVHNGIEYADMQLIAETYHLMRFSLGLDVTAIAAHFSRWNKGRLNSYLLEISAKILQACAEDGTPMIDQILDRAGQKGTGSWSTHEALDYGVPTTLITEAVLARVLSSFKGERVELAQTSTHHAIATEFSTEQILSDLEQALYAARAIAYAQGYQLMHAASMENGWGLDLVAISKGWRAGCIIRGALLQELIPILAAEQPEEQRDKLLGGNIINGLVADDSGECETALRRVVVHGLSEAVPMPCFAAALNYFDGMRSAVLPANMIQAQRDYFGAHGFQRVGDELEGLQHFDWQG